MDLGGSRLRRDVNRARGREVVRQVQRRLTELEFVDGAGGNVLCGSSHSFIRNVNTININASCTPVAAAERNGRVSWLRRIEILTVLNLDSAFDVGEVKKIAAVD